MISSIEGILAGTTQSTVVVEVGGFGIEVSVPDPLAGSIGMTGETVRLLTWLYVREDQLSLFGFATAMDRRMFLSLISISGIGPKVALGMISSCDSSEIASLIHSGDTAGLVRLPGIGKKTAERIIVELKDRIDLSEYSSAGRQDGARTDDVRVEDAIAALVSIGLTKVGARRAVEDIDLAGLGESAGVEDIVKEALKKASS